MFFQKELSLHASNCYARECHRSDFTVATELVDRYHDELAPLVTHRFALDQVVEAFVTAADKTQIENQRETGRAQQGVAIPQDVL